LRPPGLYPHHSNIDAGAEATSTEGLSAEPAEALCRPELFFRRIGNAGYRHLLFFNIPRQVYFGMGRKNAEPAKTGGAVRH
jgi:hypothetical protein